MFFKRIKRNVDEANVDEANVEPKKNDEDTSFYRTVVIVSKLGLWNLHTKYESELHDEVINKVMELTNKFPAKQSLKADFRINKDGYLAFMYRFPNETNSVINEFKRLVRNELQNVFNKITVVYDTEYPSFHGNRDWIEESLNEETRRKNATTYYHR